MFKTFALSFLFAVAVFAAKPVEITSPAAFTAAELFQKLDSVGGDGTWNEWDAAGVRDPEIAKLVFDKKGALKKDVEHGWLLTVPGKPSLFAALSKDGCGEKITVSEIAKLSTKVVPLDVTEPLDPKTVFRDYRETIPGHFVHLDDTNLQVVVRDNEIQFSYLKPDAQALSPVFNFKDMPEQQKQNEIEMRRDFYAYEYSLMVRAFVASTRGLFNWQIWHWYNKNWTRSAMISDKEIAQVLSAPDQGKFVRIFFKKLAGGGYAEMQTNAHGSFLMTIRR